VSVVSFNPCLDCGACCAFYRASFYWSEADPELGGTVPPELTESLTPHMAAMKGTCSNTPRCIALHGNIGERVECTIYPVRSSACRDFPFAWDSGQPNPRCDKARSAWGLPPLHPPAPIEPDQPSAPKAA
jgi:Fe-S-cluster containining protein